MELGLLSPCHRDATHLARKQAAVPGFSSAPGAHAHATSGAKGTFSFNTWEGTRATDSAQIFKGEMPRGTLHGDVARVATKGP